MADKKKANRKRHVVKEVRFYKEEWQTVKQNIKEARLTTFSSYARKLLVEKRIVVIDFKAIKELSRELNKIGNNINQLARVANESQTIYSEEMADIKKSYKELSSKLITGFKKVIEKEIKNRGSY